MLGTRPVDHTSARLCRIDCNQATPHIISHRERNRPFLAPTLPHADIVWSAYGDRSNCVHRPLRPRARCAHTLQWCPGQDKARRSDPDGFRATSRIRVHIPRDLPQDYMQRGSSWSGDCDNNDCLTSDKGVACWTMELARDKRSRLRSPSRRTPLAFVHLMAGRHRRRLSWPYAICSPRHTATVYIMAMGPWLALQPTLYP